MRVMVELMVEMKARQKRRVRAGVWASRNRSKRGRVGRRRERKTRWWRSGIVVW